MNANLVEIRITVRGAVQGVGYRWFARETAVGLGLAGWVRNLPDGSVEVEVRGPRSAIDAFVATLREGPPNASVSEVRTASRTSSAELQQRFTILR
jgi:acylphosphatase